ncbi:unnamed protein product [Tilletia controversa]|nr:unnamed protein product [Tilletia controversa]
MKKFFSRFSTGPTAVAASSSSSSSHSGLPPTDDNSGANPKASSSPNGNGNVRSIAARFESFSSPPASPSVGGGGVLTPSSSILPALQTITNAGLPPPAPAQQQQPSLPSAKSSTPNLPSVILNGNTNTNGSSTGAGGGPGGRRTKEARDASGGSSAANSSSASTTPHHPTKTVAFAPSPKKAVRSPILDNHASSSSAASASASASAAGSPTNLATPPPNNHTSSFSFPTTSSSSSSGGHDRSNGSGGGVGGGVAGGMVENGGGGGGGGGAGSDTDLLRSFAKPTAASLARAAFRSGSPQLSTASGGSASLYSKRISLPSRSLLEAGGREGSLSYQSTGARGVGGPSWSEMTEDDLVMNLGPRERTRQEVLWEIVASEERYVHELQRTQLFYLEALLHPYRFSTKELPLPPNSPPPGMPQQQSASSSANGEGAGMAMGMGNNGAENFAPSKLTETVPEHPVELPIAARWMNTSSGATVGVNGTSSPSAGSSSSRAGGGGPPSTAAIIQSSYRPLAGSRSSTGSPRLPGAALPSTPGGGAGPSGSRTASGGAPPASSSSSNNKPTRSATFEALSVPAQPHPLSRSEDLSNSNSSSSPKTSSPSASRKGRRGASLAASASSAWKGKLPMFPTFPGSSQGRGAPDPLEVLLPVSLPTPVRIVLETISEGLLHEHALLSDALKNRYQEQWPLVRTLADVFLKHSFLLQHYARYVCHLERALEFLEEAALMERAMRGKRIRKEKMTQTVAVGRAIAALEIIAAERGEPGLALFISKPFQRLLKYPLLFQNLLFHTDPSTYEFESTVGMVVEVERIVRSIEDEKVSAEERDRSRDAFARIDGITDKAVLKPKADRTLVEEKPLYDEGPRRALSESRTEGVGLANSEALTSELTSGPRASVGKASGAAAAAAAAAAAGLDGPSSSLRAMLKSKRSFRRLSDFLGPSGLGAGGDGEKGGASGSGSGAGGGNNNNNSSSSPGGSAPTKAPNLGSKRDLWVIRFSDVELRCQRTGTTTLPMVSSAALRPEGQPGPPGSTSPQQGGGGGGGTEDEVPDFASRAQYSKERLRALRNTTLRAKTRNLYKFIAVQSWKTAAPSAAAAAYAARRAEGLARAIEEVEAESESDLDGEGESDTDEDEGGGQGLGIQEEDGPTESEESGGEEFGTGNAGGGGGGGAGGNQERFVREAKLSFSYWGDDRVEPRPSATYSSASTKSPALSSVAAFRAAKEAKEANSAAATSAAANGNSNGNGNGNGAGAGAGAGPHGSNVNTNGHGPHSASSASSSAGGGGGGGAQMSGRGDLSHLVQSAGSTPNLRSLSPSKRLAAESVVAGSHAGPRVQKFGNRLRSAAPATGAESYGHGTHDSSVGSSSGRVSGTLGSSYGGSGTVGGRTSGTTGQSKSGRVSNSSYR